MTTKHITMEEAKLIAEDWLGFEAGSIIKKIDDDIGSFVVEAKEIKIDEKSSLEKLYKIEIDEETGTIIFIAFSLNFFG